MVERYKPAWLKEKVHKKVKLGATSKGLTISDYIEGLATDEKRILNEKEKKYGKFRLTF